MEVPDLLTIFEGVSVDLYAKALQASGNYTFLWSTGETTAAITVSPAGTTDYTVTVTDTITGCTTNEDVTVTVEVCTPVYDCPNLSANIGDSCDDGDATTENDVINASCNCVGTPIVFAIVESTIPNWDNDCAVRDVVVKRRSFD